MRLRPSALAFLAIASLAQAQAQAPTTKPAVGDFDAAIVRHAAAFIPTAAQWNRADNGTCPRAATSYSIRCALERAIVEAAGLNWHAKRLATDTTKPAPLVNCTMDISAGGGSCGTLWDELPVFTMSRANAITTGKWRADASPESIWSGKMADAEDPVNAEAPRAVALVSPRKYSARLVDFNNDTLTTWPDLQSYFRTLEARVQKEAGADLDNDAEVLELEIYPGGTGVIRTYNGWFPVTNFVADGSTIRLQVDTLKQVAPNALDREILQRASNLLSSDAVWNRADDCKCPATATTWSIYCAVEKAEIEVTGGFHHRRPAGELVREIVDERAKDRAYGHRLMGYNNDPTTKLEDVHSLFAEALARIR